MGLSGLTYYFHESSKQHTMPSLGSFSFFYCSSNQMVLVQMDIVITSTLLPLSGFVNGRIALFSSVIGFVFDSSKQ
jgi:hypothetical protein